MIHCGDTTSRVITFSRNRRYHLGDTKKRETAITDHLSDTIWGDTALCERKKKEKERLFAGWKPVSLAISSRLERKMERYILMWLVRILAFLRNRIILVI